MIMWVRRFCRIAERRLEEAAVLRHLGYNSGAVYLAGYAVECMLKALALAQIPLPQHDETVHEFRNRFGHDFESLRARYLSNLRFPLEISRAFSSARTWSTELRYDDRSWRNEPTDKFLGDVRTIVNWCKGRLQ